MRLSERIHKLADMVDQGESVADIGTDHGYVPMLLMREKVSPKAIMSDISAASLSKARETFETVGIDISDQDFRVGDGLDTLDNGETDCVIIAGLGGHTIVEILDADIEKSMSFKKLILQPRKHSGALRHYLYTHGWDICGEVLSKEGKFECEIITAKPAGIRVRKELYPADDIRWKYPEMMAKNNPELARSRMMWKLGSIEEQLQNLKAAGSDKSGLIEDLNKEKEYLMLLIDKCSNDN